MPVQVRADLHARLKAEKTPGDADDEAVETHAAAEGGDEAYAPYSRRARDLYQLAAPPFLFACAQRTALLRSILEAPSEAGGCALDLSHLTRERVVSQVFALHDADERIALEEAWTTASAMAMAPAPLAKLCNYFGPQYALYFAYLRTYSLWLWPPAILGALLFIVQESVYGGQENVWGAFFCLLLIAWAAGFAQAWRRREAGLREQWGLPKAVPEIERPGFNGGRAAGLSGAFAAGFYTENDQFVPVDPAAVLEGADVPVAPAMSNFERKLRLVFSWAIILLAMGLTVTTQLALLLFRSVAQQLVDPAWLGGLAAAVACAVVVEGMQLWMTPMVGALVHFQRHRSYGVHEGHHAAQLFALSFVNRFFSPFYLAVLKKVQMPQRFLFIYEDVQTAATTAVGQGDTGLTLEAFEETCRDRSGNPSDDCMEELFTQILALVVVNALLQNAVEYAGVAFAACCRRVTRGGTRVASEAALAAADGTHLAHNLFELSMSFAMVALFAGACPLVGLVALLNNAIEGRCDAFLHLRCLQRPMPRRVGGFGAWNSILTMIAYLGILTNSILLCHTSTALPKLFLASTSAYLSDAGGSRFVLLLLIEHAFLALKLLVDLLIPDVEEGYVARLASQRKLLALAVDARARRAGWKAAPPAPPPPAPCRQRLLRRRPRTGR